MKQIATKRAASVALAWLAVFAWAALIFFMSSNTPTNLTNDLGFFSQVAQAVKELQALIVGPSIDLLSPAAHFAEYLVLGVLLTNALRHHISLKRACLFAIIAASFYGISDEIHQLFVPGRMSDPLDWVVDTLGAGVGVLAARTILQRQTHTQREGASAESL